MFFVIAGLVRGKTACYHQLCVLMLAAVAIVADGAVTVRIKVVCLRFCDFVTLANSLKALGAVFVFVTGDFMLVIGNRFIRDVVICSIPRRFGVRVRTPNHRKRIHPRIVPRRGVVRVIPRAARARPDAVAVVVLPRPAHAGRRAGCPLVRADALVRGDVTDGIGVEFHVRGGIPVELQRPPADAGLRV